MPEEPSSPPCPAARKAPIKLRYWFMGFVLLAVVGVWLANERSYARLQAYKQQLIAKGEKLGIADHIPKLPPASSNGAPDFLAAAARLGKVPAPFSPIQLIATRSSSLAAGHRIVKWRCPESPTGRNPDRWPVLFAHVEVNRHVLAEMSTALERPEFVFEGDYAKDYEMYSQNSERKLQALDALASAMVVDLRMGSSYQAFGHLLTLSRLARLQAAPAPVGLLPLRCTPVAMLATWEALQFPGWSDSQLGQLQAVWQSRNLREAWLAAANMESAMMIEAFSRGRSNPSLLFPDVRCHSHYHWETSLDLSGNLSENWDILKFRTWENTKIGLWRLCFSHEDELRTLQHRQIPLEETRAAWASGAFGPAHLRAMTDYKRFHGCSPMMIGARQVTLLEDLDLQSQLSLANHETARRITSTAIALHRHRLKQRKFPESLRALVPEFLVEVPRDFMDGQPLRYKLQPDGQFLLWSVGDDLNDDGGDPNPPAHETTGSIFNCFNGRDWVWPLPATEAEVAAYHAALAARRSPPPDP